MEVYSGDMLDFNITLRFIESISGFTVQEQSQNRYMMTSIFLGFFFLIYFFFKKPNVTFH